MKKIILFFFQSYPEELQTRGDHFENPLAPYETVIDYTDLSAEAKRIMKLNGVKSKNYSQKKLISDFRPRIDYVTHVENLQFYLKHGLKLEKVSEIISFDQSTFAHNFVQETTLKRHQSHSKIEKAMWKFFNNVLFGKSMQDASKNVDVDILWRSKKHLLNVAVKISEVELSWTKTLLQFPPHPLKYQDIWLLPWVFQSLNSANWKCTKVWFIYEKIITDRIHSTSL